MKQHARILSLLATAITSLMAFASSASAAPTLTSPSGTEYTGTIHATLQSGTSALLKAGIEDTCTESTSSGPVTTNNETHAQGSLSSLTFGKCTQHTNTRSAGSLTINQAGEVFTTSSSVEVVVTGIATCFYGAGLAPVHIGTLTPTSINTFTAKLDVSTTELPRAPGSNTFFCASQATWTGSYVVTTPDTLYVK